MDTEQRTLDPNLEFFGERVRGGLSPSSGRRTRREELGHESRTREGQCVEEREDGVRQQRNCSGPFSRADEHCTPFHVRVIGREMNQKPARRKY